MRELPVPAAARRWLLLAVAAIALSAVLAIVLVLSRTPGVQGAIPLAGLFQTVLVLHVNFAILVWLLAFTALIWRLQAGDAASGSLERTGFSLAVLGALLILVSPGLGPGDAVMSNYVPVIDGPGYFAGLIAFLFGICCVAWSLYPRLHGALRLSALMWFITVLVWLYHAGQLAVSGGISYEALFWGGGHILQFVYLLVLWTVWRWPDTAMPPRLGWLTAGLMGVALGLALAFPAGSAVSRSAFTQLMQFGTPLLLLPMFWYLATRRRSTLSVYLSAGLMLTGLLIGLLIREDTVVVTAHYHATNAALTIAFMGLAYRLLAGAGLADVDSRLQRAQLGLYAVGMVLYVLGMAASGWLGVPRKVAMLVEQSPERLAMGLMGLGGALSILATLLFVSLVLLALRSRAYPLEVKA